MKIDEIAKLAGVSTATISRVINDSPKVRPATAEHVKRIIDEFHYVPNTSARSLRVGRTRLLALIVSDIKNPFFPELIDRFEALAAQHGSDVIFTHTNYDPARLEHCFRRMVERNVDGIAVMTSEVDPKALAYLRRTKIPMVLLNQPAKLAAGVHNIVVDYRPGFLEAVAHLRQLGHADIGMIAGPAGISSAEKRLTAFQEALKANRLRFRKQWIAAGDFHVDGGFAAMKTILSQDRRPTAVIAANDLMAVGGLNAAREEGLSIPKDLSIIGFDNIDICTMANPPLTTIGVSRAAVATRAFTALTKGGNSKRRIRVEKQVVSTALIVRESTGPAKKQPGEATSRKALAVSGRRTERATAATAGE